MTGLTPASGLTSAEQTARRMRAIASGLAAAGLETSLYEGRTGIDLTATARQAGQREIDVVIDEDSYCELRFWVPADSVPTQVADVILRALSTITEAWQA